jgi:hypothetical protein
MTLTKAFVPWTHQKPPVVLVAALEPDTVFCWIANPVPQLPAAPLLFAADCTVTVSPENPELTYEKLQLVHPCCRLSNPFPDGRN